MKLQKLIIFLFVFLSCTSDEVTTIENEENNNVQTTIESTLEPWSSALGKSPETFVSTWNSNVNSISNDEDTILFFSIDPDEVKWSTFDQEELVYKWGDASIGDNVFILNLWIYIYLLYINVYMFMFHDEMHACIISLYILFVLKQ